jgi:predicted  nucleic acid-binding Zn-ribbon protein
MDFGTWSPSHTVLVLAVLVAFIGQVAVLFYRTGQTEKRVDKLAADIRQQREDFIHAIERLEERTDKRFVEVNQQIIGLGLEMSQQITGLRSEMSQQITGLRSEMNQRISEVRDEISEVRTEIGGIRTEISKLNQNHIEHLTHHHNS